MTNVTIGFDETVLAKAVVDQVVQAVQDEFHKIFPRLRRDEIEDATHPLTGETSFLGNDKASKENAQIMGKHAVAMFSNISPNGKETFQEVAKSNSENLEKMIKVNRSITPTFLPAHAYVIKNKVDPIIVPGNLTLEEGFWFISKEQDGSAKLTSYHVLETNNA